MMFKKIFKWTGSHELAHAQHSLKNSREATEKGVVTLTDVHMGDCPSLAERLKEETHVGLRLDRAEVDGPALLSLLAAASEKGPLRSLELLHTRIPDNLDWGTAVRGVTRLEILHCKWEKDQFVRFCDGGLRGNTWLGRLRLGRFDEQTETAPMARQAAQIVGAELAAS